MYNVPGCPGGACYLVVGIGTTCTPCSLGNSIQIDSEDIPETGVYIYILARRIEYIYIMAALDTVLWSILLFRIQHPEKSKLNFSNVVQRLTRDT